MGRYTTVQAYADNNANMRSVPYDQAVVGGGGAGSGSGSEVKKGGVRPEKVDNPYGSTAGAGSGEFHVYRHARSREMVRLRGLDEAEAEEKADAEFAEKVEGWRAEEQRALEKRRKKRKRGKEARERRKNLKLGGVGEQQQQQQGQQGVGDGVDVAVAAGAASDGVDVAEDEFEYKPMHQPAGQEEVISDGGGAKMASKLPPEPLAIGDADTGESSAAAAAEASESVPFANDGSFLEMMKRKLAEEAAAASTEPDEPATSISGAPAESTKEDGAEGPDS